MFDWLKKKKVAGPTKPVAKRRRATDPSDKAFLDLALRALDAEDDDVVLEVGFGFGEALLRLQPLLTRGRLAGVDSDGEAVAEARSVFAEEFSQFKVELKEGVISRLPFPDRTFTRVLCRQSMGSWLNPGKGLAEIHRVLEPGGAVALLLPPASKSQGKILGSLEVRTLLREAGFEEPRVWEGEGEAAGALAMHARRPR